jgi:parvulin-like peptidyl-prolyl isomerase
VHAVSRTAGGSIAIAVMVAWTLSAGAQAPAKSPDPKPATSANKSGTTSKPASKTAVSSEGAVATVGGVRITRAQFDRRVREAEESYRSRSNGPVPAQFAPVLRREALEGLIRENLLALEARRRGITLTTQQAEEILKQDEFFQTRGLFDEAKYLAVRSTQPEQFKNAVAEIQRTYPARQLKQEMEKQNRPDEAAVRADLTRRLSEVTIDYLALRWGAFYGDTPEPTERDVNEYYRQHAGEFQVPERTRVTLVTVVLPAPAPGGGASELQNWESRMRGRADSLANAVRKGASLETLAPSFGSLQTVELGKNETPPNWRGSAKAVQAISTAPVGTVLDPVPGKPGYVVTRIVERVPPHAAPLSEVSRSIRAQLRAAKAQDNESRELATIYQSMRDSLRGPAYRVRYAVADTSIWPVSEPSPADLDRYYRGHMADYSFYDPKTSSVGSKPLPEVRADVRARLLAERRESGARAAAEQLLATWKAGKRDAKLERSMARLREVGPVPVKAAVDTGLAGQALSDTLAARPAVSMDMIPFERGWVVYQTYDRVKDYTPTQDQVHAELIARRAAMQAAREEAGARRLYDQNPSRFSSPRRIVFSRVMVNPPEAMTIPLTREQVVQRYQSHLEDYGAPELVHARHILIIPTRATPQADAEARAKAEDLMRRIRAGEKLADLAPKYSDDEATRDKGGDVGVFGRGTMLDEFERTAFTMDPGDVRGPIRTEVGYHIIECIEHVPAEVTPLKYAYGNVAADAAHEVAERTARFRADSLRRNARTPARALKAAEAMRLTVFHNEISVGDAGTVPYLRDYFTRLGQLKPGEFDSQIQEYHGMGYAVSWVDSIAAPRPPSWDEAHFEALDLYRREENHHRVLAKRAELDSLLQAGWSFDSLCALSGGAERYGPAGPGKSLERLSGQPLLDSLAFGTRTSKPVLVQGQATPWIEFPGGFAKLKLVLRGDPDPVEMANRMATESRITLERNQRKAYDKLRQRYPVEILDPQLRLVDLPELPDSS